MPKISVIIPTLNEEKYIGNLFKSLQKQEYRDFEVIIVDGGSTDGTVDMSGAFGYKTIIVPRLKEYAARNKASEMAQGEILLFSAADVVFPDNLLNNIARKFDDQELTAVAGPGIPVGASTSIAVEYLLYNCARCIFAHLPRPLKRFSTSTSLLAVRRNAFEAVGGLDTNDINADGMLGRKLCDRGKVWFSFFKVKSYVSTRRIESMGLMDFNKHFLYVLENFFHALSSSVYIRGIKTQSYLNHSDMRETVTVAGEETYYNESDILGLLVEAREAKYAVSTGANSA
jgi:glycosyltransferase involved in cell wall biosynthesis